MNPEENKRMEALAYIIADLKAENIEMTQRVHQLTTDYNTAVHQLGCKEARKDEDSSNQMPEEMQNMFDRCSDLELENEKLKRIAIEFHNFVEDKKLYMKNKSSCGYEQDRPVVGYKSCQECSSCLGVIEGLGVICKKRLAEAKVRFSADE